MPHPSPPTRPATGPSAGAPPGGGEAPRLSTGHEIYWWVEIGIVLVFDLIYESLRDLNSAGTAHAFHNATAADRLGARLHIYAEHDWQRFALAHAKWAVIGANYYYGAVYLLLTVAALVFLYRRFPDDYPLWRNTLAIGTMLGLIGFATFPLMPPRLLDTLRPPRRLRLRRHAGQVPDVLVVQLVGHEDDLEPVRGHAQPALRLGAVGLRRVPAAGQVVVGQGAGRRSTRWPP